MPRKVNKKNLKEQEIETKSKNIKERFVDLLALPREVLLNLPRISMVGNEEFHIENVKGIIEYGEERIRINTSIGVVKIDGKNLFIKNITSEELVVQGIILLIEFVR